MNAKFLIDSGSTINIISNKLANLFEHLIRPFKTKVISFNCSTPLNKIISLPLLKDFNYAQNIDLLVHDFHQEFDGLLGFPLLSQFQFVLDTYNRCIKNSYVTIPLQNQKQQFFFKTLSPHQIFTAQIPVSLSDGDYLVNFGKLDNVCEIHEIISTVQNNELTVLFENKSNENFNLKIDIDEFINKKVEPLANYFISEEFCAHVENNFNFDISKIRTQHLNFEEKQRLYKILDKNRVALFDPNGPLHFTSEIQHEIKTKDNEPVHAKTYRFPFVHKQEVQRQIEDMLNKGIIRESTSPYSAPIWIVPKKQDASNIPKWRLVIDYRKLNEKTIEDKHPIPNIDDLLDKLGKCNYFTTLDLASGFHQIQVHPNSIEKTAFSTESGHYEFLRMPFGLRNAPATFQRMINSVLRNFINKNCLVYMDDVIIFSTSLEEHLLYLDQILKTLSDKGLKIQLDKCEFLQKEVLFLGHKVTKNGLEPNPEKIKSIINFPLPKTSKEIKSFLGLVGYYRKFICNFAKIAKPLTQCLKKGNKIFISKDYIDAVEKLKRIISEKPILQRPDFNKSFIVTTDASNYAIGAVLSQNNNNSIDLPICYASRTLNKSEINYSTIEKELLAIVWACKMFRPYLYGNKFILRTDHRPLQWLFSLKDPQSKLVRWRLKLEEFDYTIQYVKGKTNYVADALSRIKTQEEVNINEDTETIDATMNDTHSEISRETVSKSGKETIHSNKETILEIPYSEKAINHFANQIYIYTHNKIYERRLVKLFGNKNKRIINLNTLEDLPDQFNKILKEELEPTKTNAFLISDENIEKEFIKHTQKTIDKNIKILICKTKLIDCTNHLMQKDLIRKTHENSNHKGINENLNEIQKRYYFPGIQKQLTKFINNCKICLEAKVERRPLCRQPELKNPVGNNPFEHHYIDTITLDKEIFLTFIDSFSRYGQAIQIFSKNAIDIKSALLKIFSHHNVPNFITSDNGWEFNNTLIKELALEFNVTWHYNISNRPHGRGLVERFHSSLLDHIRTLKLKYPTNKNISELVSLAIIYYNNNIHSATKHKPFFIIHGTESQALNNIPVLHEMSIQDKVEKDAEKIQLIRETVVPPPVDITPLDIPKNATIFVKRKTNKTQPQFKQTNLSKIDKKKIFDNKDDTFHEQQLKIRKHFQDESTNDSDNHTNQPSTDPDYDNPQPGCSYWTR